MRVVVVIEKKTWKRRRKPFRPQRLAIAPLWVRKKFELGRNGRRRNGRGLLLTSGSGIGLIVVGSGGSSSSSGGGGAAAAINTTTIF